MNQRLDIKGKNKLFPTCQTHYEVQLEHSLYTRNIKTLTFLISSFSHKVENVISLPFWLDNYMKFNISHCFHDWRDCWSFPSHNFHLTQTLELHVWLHFGGPFPPAEYLPRSIGMGLVLQTPEDLTAFFPDFLTPEHYYTSYWLILAISY